MKIALSEPNLGEREKEAVRKVLQSGDLKGGGKYDEKCATLIEEQFDATRALMTTSCTHSLEMAALLTDIQPGDEVILPSFTFPSTANAFALYGANLKFCDINRDTLNMDVEMVQELASEKTKAIVTVHYGGIACDMESILKIAEANDALVIEDAAQGVNAKYRGEYLGTIGDIGCFSFHETKSYAAGEGGAVILNDEEYIERAEYIRQKGTNYSKFQRGEVDKYTWVSLGSSYTPSEMQSALAYEQLRKKDKIKSRRISNWNHYLEELSSSPVNRYLRLPEVPDDREPNGHLFWVVVEGTNTRNELVTHLRDHGIGAASHYEPLHSSRMGQEFGYTSGDLPVTENVANSLLRLPVHEGLTRDELNFVIDTISKFEFEES